MIARRTPIARSTKPIPKKRKARAYKTPRCDYATPTGRHPCKKPQAVKWIEATTEDILGFIPMTGQEYTMRGRWHRFRGMCASHAKIEAHRRVSAFVRDRDGGRCVIPHADLFPCAGPLQPNHGFDRDEKTVTFDPRDVWWGCAAINTWAHHNKFRWYERCRTMWGEALYAELKDRVLHGEPMNVAEVLAKYPPRLTPPEVP